MKVSKALLTLIFCVVLAIGLAACGASSEDNGGHKKGGAFTVGGTVSGLEGTGLMLLLDPSDTLSISANGTFVFNTTVANGEAYNVEVASQPTNPVQTCTVNNGTGTIQGADVTDVTVICSGQAYTVGGTASGITSTVVLQNNGGDDLPLTSDGPFVFSTPVANTAGYDVTVLSSPGLGCALSNSTGTVNGANITDVAVSCIPAVVSALYNTSGADWNDYVKDDGGAITNATDTACDAATDTSCLHGGELRVVEVPESSCTGLTASDSLGVFDWTCDDSTGTVRFISTGLKDGKNLSDLIDFASPDWKTNSVTVDGGLNSYSTLPAVWWSNPVEVDNDGGYLDTAGTIYVVTNDDLGSSGEGYIINASSVGLVGQPGLIINGPAAGVDSRVIKAEGGVNDRDFLWLEGNIDAVGDYHGIYLVSVRFSVLRDVTATGASLEGIYTASSSNNTFSKVAASNNEGSGIRLNTSSDNNTLSEITVADNNSAGFVLESSSGNTLGTLSASNNIDSGLIIISSSDNTVKGVRSANSFSSGVLLSLSTNNTLSDITAANNISYGIYINDSTGNMLSDITASNNGSEGVWCTASSTNNTLSGVTATNNAGIGVYVYSLSSSNILMGVSASNNGTMGVEVNTNSNYNTLIGVAATNNGWHGIYVNNSSYATISNVASSNNANNGVNLGSSSDNYFTGLLKVGNNSSDCFVSGGTNPGLVNTTCSTAGTYGSGGLNGYGVGNSSDATLYNGVTLEASFVGSIYNDTANSSDTGSAVAYPADPATFDWLNFENQYRGWGKDGTFDASSRGQWTSGDGAIWDWSLTATGDTGDSGSPALLDVLGLPTGNDTLTHIWYGTPATNDNAGCDAMVPGSVFNTDHCETTFLRNAVEIGGTGGNDNLLCESGETCLYTPNIGSYQGHGSLVSAGGFIDGTLTGITLMEYDTNGR